MPKVVASLHMLRGLSGKPPWVCSGALFFVFSQSLVYSNEYLALAVVYLCSAYVLLRNGLADNRTDSLCNIYSGGLRSARARKPAPSRKPEDSKPEPSESQPAEPVHPGRA